MADIVYGGVGPPLTVTDGGGAAAVVVDVINAQWANAQAKSRAGVENINTAIAISSNAPQMVPPTLDTSYLPPPPPPFPPMDPDGGEVLYDEKVAELLEMIQDQFTGFINKYFPNPEVFEHAMQWCDNAITVGGSGIKTSVEQALWQRDLSRISMDNARANDEASSKWANMRMPLPPGTLVALIAQNNLDAARKSAESSRTVAIKSFEQEIENVKFAVKLVIDQRAVALNAAGDYIKTLMMGPQTAMQLATGLQGLQVNYISAMVSYYSAQVQALQPQVQLAIAEANMELESAKANLVALGASVDAQAKAALAGAQMVAQQAAAGLNAVNAQAGISGQDSTNVAVPPPPSAS